MKDELMSARTVQERLVEIAAAIKAGQSPKTFERELDALLGTTMASRDEAEESAWEAEYRRTDSPTS